MIIKALQEKEKMLQSIYPFVLHEDSQKEKELAI